MEKRGGACTSKWNHVPFLCWLGERLRNTTLHSYQPYETENILLVDYLYYAYLLTMHIKLCTFSLTLKSNQAVFE